MIQYNRFELSNGLRVLVHEDNSTPMAAVNVLYNIGSRDESPTRTGFAHLFEHLMFGGSAHIPDFDDPIQLAGGENNAFTNSDMTNFYDVLPAQNLEIAFWLESDRMLSLNFDPKVLATQQKVVVEEFKETCLNQPYGDAWHHLSDLAYHVHPYRWPTIGLEPRHIEEATLDEVQDFYFKYYRPNNAILVVSGNVKTREVRALAEKWFGDIPPGVVPARQLQPEPPQDALHRRISEANVPLDAFYLAFHMPGRSDKDYYAADLLSDVLSHGQSSRLFRRLLKEKQLFSSVDCYVSGSLDPGLFIIEGKPNPGVSIETAKNAIWEELEMLKTQPIPDAELQKLQNKVESTLAFSETSVLNKAINLAFFELLGDANLINEEAQLYRDVTPADIQRLAQQILAEANCSELIYLKKNDPAPIAEPTLVQESTVS
ncbi:MAG TPA: pitrilysin family protein [Saprospiraceae bacterium]|nr:pitrilysin family protein [Saprospiraceae bacterium]HMP25647.1 pitrilysin family protein [Saprospiraceae bacterium]